MYFTFHNFHTISHVTWKCSMISQKLEIIGILWSCGKIRLPLHRQTFKGCYAPRYT